MQKNMREVLKSLKIIIDKNMITVHVDLLDRFNRAMPILGIPFFIFQVRKSLQKAKEGDRVYIQGVKNLGKEPPAKLLDHSVKQERFLIGVIASCLLTLWLLSITLLYGKIMTEFLFIGITLAGMLLDYMAGKIALKIFTLNERSGSSAKSL